MRPGHDRDQLTFALLSRRLGSPRKLIFSKLHAVDGPAWISVGEDSLDLPAIMLQLHAGSLEKQHVSGHVWMKSILQHGWSLGSIRKASGFCVHVVD